MDTPFIKVNRKEALRIRLIEMKKFADGESYNADRDCTTERKPIARVRPKLVLPVDPGDEELARDWTLSEEARKRQGSGLNIQQHHLVIVDHLSYSRCSLAATRSRP